MPTLTCGWFDAWKKTKGRKPTEEEQDKGKAPERSSFVEADPARLQLHVSYSRGMERGPIIHRTGDGPPYMADPAKPGSYSTDPGRQRIGTNFVLDHTQSVGSEELFLEFAGSYALFAKLHDPGTTLNYLLTEISAYPAVFTPASREALVKSLQDAHSDDVDQSFQSDADQIGAKRRRALSV